MTNRRLKSYSGCGGTKANLRIAHLHSVIGNNILERNSKGGEDSKSLDHYIVHKRPIDVSGKH